MKTIFYKPIFFLLSFGLLFSATTIPAFAADALGMIETRGLTYEDF